MFLSAEVTVGNPQATLVATFIPTVIIVVILVTIVTSGIPAYGIHTQPLNYVAKSPS